MSPDVAAWLHDLVSRQAIEIGHPEARAQAEMAWRALDELQHVIEGGS